MIPVILSGGSGTRLWPLSRKQRPKQFLPIIDENSLFQNTILRLKASNLFDSPLIIANEDHRFMVADQLEQIDSEHQGIILEPIARNTAPAITLAALHIYKAQPDAIMFVLPSDHDIKDIDQFHDTVKKAKALLAQDQLATFGIVPTSAETGYGYIQTKDIQTPIGKVDRFIEKPDKNTAEHYLKAGNYLWNSGMFMFRASTYLEELEKYHPEIIKNCEAALANQATDLDFIRINSRDFDKNPDISIDYALMEKTDKASVIPLDAQWSDVGAWSAVWEVRNKDENGNVILGDVITQNAHNNLVIAEKRLVSLLGVNQLTVIDTQDALLIADKENVQHIKQIVSALKKDKRPEATTNREVFRPWGSYDCIDSGARFQVKRITVKPGHRLSLQKHHHRAEHWIVVKGTAEVTCQEKTFLLTENQSTYIPLGSSHRLANPGKVPLEIIEVQSGSYLEEDDIVRFDDQYGRQQQ